MVILQEDLFGVYFKNVRKSQNITQEQVASYANKNKMTISLIENGKNDPPNGKLLDDMINSLSLTDEEIISKLYMLAFKSRKVVPTDISEYFYSNIEIYKSIKRAMKQKKNNNDWKNIFK